MARVSVPLVVAKRADGSDVYLYQGAQVPEGLKEGEADRLADFIEDEKPAEDESDKDEKPVRKSSK